jgi:hypothetical protein
MSIASTVDCLPPQNEVKLGKRWGQMGAAMIVLAGRLLAALFILVFLTTCGLYVPAKSEFRGDDPIERGSGRTGYSQQGAYENGIVSHIVCELALGLQKAKQDFALPWLEKWGTAVTITITAQDQSGINPGISFVDPLQNVIKAFPTGGNVTLPQSTSTSLGASAAATATRTETIQFTYLNSDLIQFATYHPDCLDALVKGAQIDGDLKIRQFVYDKAMIGRLGNASLYDKRSIGFKATNFKRPDLPWEWPVFNTFTEEIMFIAAYGGNVTPTWKLATFTANATGSLLALERTYTNDLVITLGPVKPPTDKTAAALDASGQSQHNIRVQASAIATSIAH